MFTENKASVVANWVDGLPRLKLDQPADTIFSLPWCSSHVDEGHECRKAGDLWQAIAAIFEVSLIKVVMTGTPLIEQAEVSSWSDHNIQDLLTSSTLRIWSTCRS